MRIEVCHAPPLLCLLQQRTNIQLIYEPTDGMSDHDYTNCIHSPKCNAHAKGGFRFSYLKLWGYTSSYPNGIGSNVLYLGKGAICKGV